MKHLLVTLGVVLALAAATAAVTYRSAGDREVRTAMSNGAPLDWLRAEFKLNENQFARIKALHEAYSGVCEEHCRAIQEAVRMRNQLKQQPDVEPAALVSAEARVQELRRICETAITAHVRQCAALMPSGQGERYLALVLPKIPDFDHQAAPSLHVSGHQH